MDLSDIQLILKQRTEGKDVFHPAKLVMFLGEMGILCENIQYYKEDPTPENREECKKAFCNAVIMLCQFAND